MGIYQVTFWLRAVLLVILLELAYPLVVFAELTEAPNQTLVAADKILISPAEKTFAMAIDISYNSNLSRLTSSDLQTESFIALSSRYQISNRLSLDEKIGVINRFDSAHSADLSNMKVQLSYDGGSVGPRLDIKYHLFTYLPTNAKDRAETSYTGGVGVGAEIVKKYSLPGLDKPGQIRYEISALKNSYSDTLDLNMQSNISYRLRNSFAVQQQVSKYFSVELTGFLQTAYSFDNRSHSFLQLSELINYQSSKNVTFYVGHTNEADPVEDDAIDSNFNLYDINESYFVSGAKITF